MGSMPFEFLDRGEWLNKDAFDKAGLDATKPPATWEDGQCGADDQIEECRADCDEHVMVPVVWWNNTSAIHDIPYASKANGFQGLDAALQINSKAHVR